MAQTDLIVRLLGDTSRLRGDMAKARGSIQSFKSAAMSAGAALGVAFGGREVIRAIGVGIKKIADFEQQIDTVAAVSGATGKAMKQLKNNALELGSKSRFTATQIGAMQETLARLGFTSRQIINTTSAVKDLALAAGEDLAESASVAAGTLKSFDLEAQESGRVANVMAESFASSALNLEKFGNAMSNAGVIAKISNISLEKTAAILGTLVDRNIEASKAGTDLRRILINIAAQGITLEEALFRVRNATDKVTEASTLFGDRAAASGVIMAENEQKIKNLTDKYSDNNEELQKMVDIMEDNLNNDLKLLESAFDGLIQKGGALTPVLREVVQNITTLANQSGEESGGLGMHLKNLIKIMTALTPATQTLAAVHKLLKHNTEEYNKEQEKAAELEKKRQKQIEQTAQAAFKGGYDPERVRAYIAALDDGLTKVADREEKIKRILEIEQKILEDLRQKEKDRVEIVRKLLAAKREDLKISKGIHEVETKNIQPLTISDNTMNTGEVSSPVSDPSANLKEILTAQLPGLQGVMDRYTSQVQKFNEEAEALNERARQNAQAIAEGISGLITSFAQAIAAGEKPLKAAGRLILGTIGGLLTRLGTTMIASGIGLTAATAALSNPFTAGPGTIAAGIIVAGIGAAMSSFAGDMSSVSAGGSVGSGGLASVSSNSNNSSGRLGVVGYDQRSQVEVGGEFRLEGNVLIAAIDKAKRQKSITG